MSTSIITTSLNKPNPSDPENRIVHVLVSGLFIFIIIIMCLALLGFFFYSAADEAFRFREVFNPHVELVPLKN